VVVAGVGVRTALLLDATSFLLVAVTLATGRHIPHAKSEPSPWRQRVREGIDYVGGQPILRRLLIAQAAAFVFFAAVIPVEIVYVKETLGGGDSAYGGLLASWGAGMVLGSLLFAAARLASLRSLLLFSTIAVGASYLAMAAAGTLAVACLAAVVGGAGNGVQWVSVISTIQGVTADRFQARVLGLLESIGSVMPGIGFVLGGVIAYVVEPRASFLIAGLGVLAVAALALPLLRRTDWEAVREGASSTATSRPDEPGSARPSTVS
jgi:MFS family permease